MMGDLNIEVTGCSACGHWHRVNAQKLDQPQQFDGQWWSHAFVCPNTRTMVFVMPTGPVENPPEEEELDWGMKPLVL